MLLYIDSRQISFCPAAIQIIFAHQFTGCFESSADHNQLASLEIYTVFAREYMEGQEGILHRLTCCV